LNDGFMSFLARNPKSAQNVPTAKMIARRKAISAAFKSAALLKRFFWCAGESVPAAVIQIYCNGVPLQ
jgi:hypothetical protein